MSYTSRLLNYVEPYFIDGIAKTAFYTEVNTNLQRNDKVFVVNGFYDSEVFIRRGKWVKNADGYRVLFVDRCKVVLDIDWESGQFAGLTQTFREDNFENFIKVYNVRSQREFDYINKIKVDSYTFSRVSKFEQNLTNNLIYSDVAWDGAIGLGENNGIQTTKSFWARSGQDWVNLTSDFIGNTLTFSATYSVAGLTNNSRFFVLGEDINYGGRILKERNVYKWTDNAHWVIDKDYKQPIISKLYFKDGVFRGTHNDGVYGSYDRPSLWSGTPSVWNSGFFVNSDWASGRMRSKSTVNEQSYYSTLVNGQPVQTTDFSNNKGHGYNYVLDSNIRSGTIESANAINCNVGVYNSGLTAIDDYFGITGSYAVETGGGLYTYCDVNNAKLSNSTTLDSIVRNSHLVNTRALNTQVRESYSHGGEFSVNEGGISVTSADLSSYIPEVTSATHSGIRGVLKLYIDDSDLNRLDTFDSFYLTRINKEYIISTLDSDMRVWLPIETKYILDTFYDFFAAGSDQECMSALKTSTDNRFITIVESDGSTYTTESYTNGTRRASIDVDLGAYLAFYRLDGNYVFLSQSYLDKSAVNNLFKDTAISNSEFRDGVVRDMLWSSGSHLNYPSNRIKWQGTEPMISKASDREIAVTLVTSQPTINDDILRRGSYVWLDSIIHTSDYGTVSNLGGVYTIATQSDDLIYLVGDQVSSIDDGGTYSVVGGHMPNYLSLHKLLIDRSTVRSGLFVRNLFRSTTFENEQFNNSDYLLTNQNVQRLRVLNNFLSGTAGTVNTVRAGVFHNGHMDSVDWSSGISDNSVWQGPEFKGGVFNYGIWADGTFSGGRFQNSRGLTYSPEDYSLVGTHYRNWRRGTFNGGEFYNSVWLEGTFNLGKMWGSDWYGGVWNNGILGDATTPTSNTTMAKYLNIGTGATQTLWYNGVVENAEVGDLGFLTWYDGAFNGGVFSASASTSTNRSLWLGGRFNGGNFTRMAKWRNGTFNGGKFQSYYGYTQSSSTQSTDYSWEDGTFMGGEFGVGNGATNSTWYTGFFEGGVFKGRVWNSGVFTNGFFEGSGTESAVGNPASFSQGFTQSYWGLWRSGTVTDVKHKANLELEVEQNQRLYDQAPDQLNASLRNALWVGGVFNHPNGTLANSVWLDGKFRKGLFSNGSFNPYVRRDWWSSSFGTQSGFNFDLSSCVWENGKFDGRFFISDWLDGEFIGGTMSGARWFNGTWRYGWANNIYWENGTWKNGNWDGSPFDLGTLNFTQSRYDVVPGPERDMLLRIGNIHRDGKVHIINAFTGSFSDNKFVGWTHSLTDANLAQWTSQTGTGYYYLSEVSSTTPRIEVNSFQFNTYTQSFSNVSVSELQVLGSISDNDEYRVYMYQGYISVTASSADNAAAVATRLVSEINRGRVQPVVKYDQWTPNGYITRNFTWGQLVSLTTEVIDPITGLPMDPTEKTMLFTQLPQADALSAGRFTVITTNETYVYGDAISGFVPSSAYKQSERLYAMINVGGLTASIFTQSNIMYNVSMDVVSVGGRTDFVVQVSNNTYRETIPAAGSRTLNYSVVTSSGLIEEDANLFVERVTYENPDNSSFYVQGARINVLEADYDTVYNNKLYRAATYSEPFRYGPTGTSMSLPGVLPGIVVNNDAVSVKYGNGAFKYGVWETGYWNNGWHASWNTEPEYYLFKDVVQGGFVQVSNNLWAIKLTALTTTDGVSIGDKVAIGNLVFVDVNDNRRLLRSWYRVVNKTSDTITVEVNVNFAVRRIERDSDLHLIYVSRNIWQSGIFHNGYFKGVWNYGLFRGYPYISIMESTQWVDGIFDGGTFRSTKSYYRERGETQSYNNGLVQNFLFRDNNKAPGGEFKYNSWVDTNFYTYSMTNIFRENLRYDSNWGVILSGGNLKGYPSEDVLSSRSIFRNSFDSETKNYSLGTKWKNYNDLIGLSSYFTYPANSMGQPGVAEFLQNGWTYSVNSIDLHSNVKDGDVDTNRLQINYTKEEFINTGVKFVQTSKVRYFNNNQFVVENDRHPTYGYVYGDFSSDNSTPAYSPHYYQVYIDNVLQPSSTRFSNRSYQVESWPLYAKHTKLLMVTGTLVGYTNMNTGDVLSKESDPNNLTNADTITANRRVYMLDLFNPTSTDPTRGGYSSYTPSVENFTYSVSNPLASNVGGSQVNFMVYRVKKDTRLRINAMIPFKFSAREKADANRDLRARDGWSIFRIIGIVEKYSADNSVGYVDNEAGWTYVTSTELGYFPSSKFWTNGSGYGMNKVNGTVIYDGTTGTLNNSTEALLGQLSINGFEAEFKEGDILRFRLYWMDMRKSFSSSNTKWEEGGFFNRRTYYTGSPGYMELVIGRDEKMGLAEDNHGYWEIVDVNTYVNKNTNLLNNTRSNAIERSRYSVIEFDIPPGGEPISKYQGTSSVGPDLLPNIFLLNSDYPRLPGTFSAVVNHGMTPGNKREYFYNRKSLSMFFKSMESFSVQFSKIQFYETDMIPFFNYTDESSVNSDPQSPYYGVSPENAIADTTLSLDTISYTSPFGGAIPIRAGVISGSTTGGGSSTVGTNPGGTTNPPPAATSYSVDYTFNNGLYDDVVMVTIFKIRVINTSSVQENSPIVTSPLNSSNNFRTGTITVTQGFTLYLEIETSISDTGSSSGVNIDISIGGNVVATKSIVGASSDIVSYETIPLSSSLSISMSAYGV